MAVRAGAQAEDEVGAGGALAAGAALVVEVGEVAMEVAMEVQVAVKVE